MQAARDDLDHVFSLAYEELRRLASAVLRREGRASITPTALVNEAWLKLARTPGVANTDPLHFRRIAGRAMRQVLVDAARRRGADRRGAGEIAITFDENAVGPGRLPAARDVLALDGALDELRKVSPRQAQLVECRFFGGLDCAECAATLGVSEATIMRDWRAARAWLGREIRRSLAPAEPA